MKYLKDNQYPVISLRDVAKYVDAAKTTQLLAYRHTQVWGGVTKKDNRLYLCVDHLPADRKLTLPDLTTRITKAWMLADDRKNPLTIIKADSGLQTIVVPEFSKADYGDSPVVVVAELKGDPITTITDFVIPGLPAATIAKNGILVNVPLATDLTKLAPVYRTGSPPVTTSSTTCTSSIASELPIPLEPSTMNHLITNHRAPSVQIFRKLRMLCLLPLSMVALSAAEEPPPPVVDPGAVPGAPPSDAIVLFDGKDLSKFRGKNSDQPKWTLANGVMETIPGGDGNGMFSREEFGDCQLHFEWASPAILVGEGQTRG
ncbi:MAG: DUF1080 domain-containing protein, partial [Akkermansiaceae bacterium]|nr:DUF1080 domain-containing protein [Akkermansiaceae bacterium]